MAEDAAALLAEFVSSLDNLPSEVQHILQEIGHKEAKMNDIKNKALSRDQAIQKHARPVASGGQGLLEPNPKEEELIKKIRLDLDRAEVSAREKVALSERGVKLISRHLQRLQSQLELVTSAIPPLPTLPSFAPVMPVQAAPAPQHQNINPNLGQQLSNTYGAYQHPGTPNGMNYNMQQQRKMTASSQSPPIQMPMQMPPQHHSQAQYAYSPGSGAGTPLGAARGMARPGNNRLPNHLQGQPGQPHSQQIMGGSNPLFNLQQSLGANGNSPGANLALLQQQQQQQQQHAHLQQQQMRLQQQAHALAQQQLANQQQMQQLQQSANHGGNGGQQGGVANKRKRQDEEVEVEEQGDGEDLTPYCFCHRPSFGEMIGCDAPNCAIEWFHLSCVGLKSTPEGSWYCRDCEPKMQKAVAGGGRKRR